MRPRCPKCHAPPPKGEPYCPKHKLFCVDKRELDFFGKAPHLGRKISDRYVLIGYLGGGDVSVVYLGFDLRLERQIAVKTYPSSLISDKDSRIRFERECRGFCEVTSPHIARLLDYGVVPHGLMGGTAFAVFDLVRGMSLSERLEAGPLAFEEAVAIAEHIADALADAHKHGSVHQDLRPENILFTTGPDDLQVVRIIGVELAAGPRKSRPLGYTSPEQRAGKKLRGTSDIYALGAVLQESLDEALEAHPRKAAIESLLERATSRRPEDRPQSVRALAAALRRDPRPVQVAETAQGPAPTLPKSPSRLTPARLGIAGGLLAVVMVMAWWLTRPEPVPEPEPEPVRISVGN